MKKEDCTCEQVTSILSFYISGNTPCKMSDFIMEHLRKCKSCREKYRLLAKGIINLTNSKMVEENKSEIEQIVQITINSTLKEKMSAYVDGELTDEENIRFKKHVIANKNMRKELEDIYNMKNAINSSIEYTKQEFKKDYSQKVLAELDLKEHVFKKSESILKIISIFIFLFTFFSIGVIVLYQILM